MGTLTDQLGRLRDDITALQESRSAFMANLARETEEMKKAVEAMQDGIRSEHAEMASRARAKRADYVAYIAGDVHYMLDAFGKALAATGAKGRVDRGAFNEELKREVNDLKRDVEMLMGGFRDSLKEMADRSKEERQEFVSKVKDDVSGLLDGFERSLAAMSKDSQAGRQEFILKVNNEVSELKSDVARIMEGIQRSLASMAESSQATRQNFVKDLGSRVQTMRKEMSDDIAGAQRAWRGQGPSHVRAMQEAERKAKEEAQYKADENASAEETEGPSSTGADENKEKN